MLTARELPLVRSPKARLRKLFGGLAHLRTTVVVAAIFQCHARHRSIDSGSFTLTLDRHTTVCENQRFKRCVLQTACTL